MMNKYCKVAAAPKARIPVDSIASGLAMSFEVIKKALENNKGRQLPNLMKIKTAFDLGRKTKEEELCESVFPCGKEINLPTEDEVMARSYSSTLRPYVPPRWTFLWIVRILLPVPKLT